MPIKPTTTGNEEMSLPIPCSDVATLFASDDIRLFYVSPLCNDGGMRMDGLSILSKRTSRFNMGVWFFGTTIPTFRKNCLREGCLEYCRCGCRYSSSNSLRERTF